MKSEKVWAATNVNGHLIRREVNGYPIILEGVKCYVVHSPKAEGYWRVIEPLTGLKLSGMADHSTKKSVLEWTPDYVRNGCEMRGKPFADMIEEMARKHPVMDLPTDGDG
jgi:hypothetical protein